MSYSLGLGCNGVVDVLIESLSDQTAASQMSFIQDCLQSQQTGAIAFPRLIAFSFVKPIILNRTKIH